MDLEECDGGGGKLLDHSPQGHAMGRWEGEGCSSGVQGHAIGR